MKEQLCWQCKNFSCCPWSNGDPIEGWVADKTDIGYLIKECPKFERDVFTRTILNKKLAYERITVEEISKLLNVSIRTAFRRLSKSQTKVKNLMLSLGYELIIIEDEDTFYRLNKCYYIRRLDKND